MAMNTVSVLAHNCSVEMYFWLLTNVVKESRLNKASVTVNGYPLQYTFYDEEALNIFRYWTDAINASNIEMSKTHRVDIQFRNEQDAVWFKLEWS